MAHMLVYVFEFLVIPMCNITSHRICAGVYNVSFMPQALNVLNIYHKKNCLPVNKLLNSLFTGKQFFY